MNEDIPPIEEDDSDDSQSIYLPPPKMSINLKSQDELQLLMSKTCIEVLTNLSKVCHIFKCFILTSSLKICVFKGSSENMPTRGLFIGTCTADQACEVCHDLDLKSYHKGQGRSAHIA